MSNETAIAMEAPHKPTPLTMALAQHRLAEFGRNVAVRQKKNHWLMLLYYALIHPFNLILLILGAISVYTADYVTACLMAILITLSTGIRFGQELKSEIAADALIALIENHATVIRVNDQGAEVAIRIPLEEVVVGDIQRLSAGDMIAGDIRIISSKDLYVSQAALTGESMPSMKCGKNDAHYKKVTLEIRRESSTTHVDIPKTIRAKFDEVDRCFMGTSVVSGSGLGEVIQTGDNTLYAAISQTLLARRTNTAFQQGLLRVSYMFIVLMSITIPVVFLMVGLLRGDWMSALEFAVSIALGLTPELLPAVVNANLSRGATQMAKHKTIVKRIDAIMNFGGMDILCTDKTGTLTKDKVSLMKYLNLNGERSASLMKMAYVNAHLQTGLRNLMDVAIEERAQELDQALPLIVTKWRLLEELPFDFQRRRVSVIVSCPQTTKERGYLMITKGAVEELIELCDTYEIEPDQPLALTAELKKQAIKLTEDLNADGQRVLAVALKRVPLGTDLAELTVGDESNLTLVGFLSFLDPPKESAKEAIQNLANHGVRVKVLTGDSPLICAKVCKEIGLDAPKILLGSDIDNVSPKLLSKLVEEATIFAKLNPMQKATIIKALKDNGHVVGFLGDGINDAPALREADVGISVDSGTAIAKETADIILLQKDLTVLVEGVRHGRVTYTNTMKYLKLSVSGSFGSIFSVVLATAWLPFLPMLPMHLVMQNLIYGIGQIAIPWDNVDEEQLRQPRVWKAENVFSFMLFLGPLTTFFDIITFAFLLYVTGWNTESHQTMFQSAWFMMGLVTQQFAIHVLRTERSPAIRSVASWQLWFATLCVIFIAIFIPTFPPIAGLVRMQMPDLVFWAFMPVTLTIYLCTCEVVKLVYQRVYKQWI